MNAHELIESYVTDVAVQLPRKQRNDVALELRALLNEELQARADEAGRPADAAMATAFLQSFGRPADVAARYGPALTIIDPADGRSFLRATVVGLALIWSLGLLLRLREPIESGSDLVRALGLWWGGTVIPSMWWPGVLVVSFGLASWARRRWPQTGEWKPRAGDRILGGRAAMILAVLGMLCGLFVLLDPTWLLDVLFGGKAAPEAYAALTYTTAFRQRQAPFLFVLVALNVPLFISVIVRGRWLSIQRRMELELGLATCAVMLWTLLDGPIFKASSSDGVAKFCMLMIVVATLLGHAIKLQRRVRPTPN